MNQNSPIILASKSPRRQELLKGMGYAFKVYAKEVDESFPPGLSPEEVAVYIAERKARAYQDEITNELLICADTIVCIDGEILGKPSDYDDAVRMLRLLSGKIHKVITGVCLLKNTEITSFSAVTEVYFSELDENEINSYIKQCQPYDKAGSYGIQEWIGYTKINHINGSYTNVVGLPTEKLYHYLKEIS